MEELEGYVVETRQLWNGIPGESWEKRQLFNEKGISEKSHRYKQDYERITLKHSVITPPQPCFCSKTHTGTPRVENGQRYVYVHDEPKGLRPVVLKIPKKRWKCPKCSNVCDEQPSILAAKRRMTKRLLEFLEVETTRSTFKDAAWRAGLTDRTAQSVFEVYAKKHVEELPETPSIIGIDEIYFGRGKVYAVITNLEKNTLIDILPSREHAYIDSYFRGMPQNKNVRFVAMDNYEPYRKAAKLQFPDAIIVFDRFHAEKLVVEAMERVRKLLKKELKSKITGRHRALITKKKLTPEQTTELELLLSVDPRLKEAREVYERFSAIWNYDDAKQAETALAHWLEMGTRGLDESLCPAFSKPVRIIKKWEVEVKAALNSRITNAATESLNGIIRSTYLKSSGLSFKTLRSKLLLAEGARVVEEKSEPGLVMSLNAKFGISKSNIPASVLQSENMVHRLCYYGVSLSMLADYLAAWEQADSALERQKRGIAKLDKFFRRPKRVLRIARSSHEV